MILDKLISKFKKNPHLKSNIKDIGLSDRTYHYLRKVGIITVGGLVELSRKDLKSFRGIVRSSVVEIEKMLEGFELGLRKDGE